MRRGDEMGKCIKKINQKISVFIVCLIVFTMLPINFAYGGTAPNVKNMKKTTLGHMYTGCFSNWYNYTYYTPVSYTHLDVYKRQEYEDTIDKISSFINYVFVIMEKDIGLEFISAIYSSQIRDLTSQSFLIAVSYTHLDVYKRQGIKRRPQALASLHAFHNGRNLVIPAGYFNQAGKGGLA